MSGIFEALDIEYEKRPNIGVSDIIRGDEIFIPHGLWDKLKTEMSEKDVIGLISEAIEKYNIPFPYQHISERNMIQDFRMLQHIDCKKLLRKGICSNGRPYRYNFVNMYIASSNIGNRASNYFHQVTRHECGSIYSPSAADIWRSDRYRRTYLMSLISLKAEMVNRKKLNEAIRLGGYIASQFKPSSAKAIYQLFGAKDILDFSSGWGDRLCGACATPEVESYTGIDPNKALFPGYNNQIKIYGGSKNIKMINSPAEDAELGNECYDLVFTSPPYFKIEKYSSGDINSDINQSWKKYKGIDGWLHLFLFKALSKSWDSLRWGGFMAINIADNNQFSICDIMNDYIRGLPGAIYKGAFGMQMSKRPNVESRGSEVFIEPIWIWRKEK